MTIKIFSPPHFLSFLRRHLWSRMPQYAQIGKYRIRLAKNSQWPTYRRSFRLYDTPLAGITKALYSKYPDLCVIDVGANVGDTAAIVRDAAEVPVLCIEGDTVILPVLRSNVSVLGSGVTIEHSFVGQVGVSVNLQAAGDLGRNACIINATGSEASIALRSLREILDKHSSFLGAKLLKIDTEGFDFEIIRHSLEFLRKSKPVVFFEYDPHFRPEQPESGLEAIEALIDEGYSHFFYFDNYGNFLIGCDASTRQTFSDLDRYLKSNRQYGAAVYYFDVCAVHESDSDLIYTIRDRIQI